MLFISNSWMIPKCFVHAAFKINLGGFQSAVSDIDLF